jgi:hypothetical protein
VIGDHSIIDSRVAGIIAAGDMSLMAAKTQIADTPEI